MGPVAASLKLKTLNDSPYIMPKDLMKYECLRCGWIYDPAEGDPDGGIKPGTPFKDIPNSWKCPVCGASKSDFAPYPED